MADYKNIKGFNIQYLDSDPPNPIEGQMWFNSTTQTLKGAEAGGAPLGTWSSGGNLNTAGGFFQSFGTQNAAIAATRYTPTGQNNLVESYNGTSWSEVTEVNTNRREGTGFGTQTAGLMVGGRNPPSLPVSVNTELYNETTWTELNDMSTGKSDNDSGWGTSSDGMYASTYPTASNELWNGTSWTSATNLSTSRQYAGGLGLSSIVGLTVGGTNPTPTNVPQVESWNGTSWTEVTELNTPRYGSVGSFGSTGIVFGGQNSPGPGYANTENWNGTTWTELNDLATAGSRESGKGSPSSAAIAFGKYDPLGFSAVTEEWNIPEYLVKTFTTS